MSTSFNPYFILGPIVLAMTLAEFIYCLWKKNGYYSFQDSLIGIGTMIIAQCVNVGVAALVIESYGWIYDRFAITHFENTLLNFAICYIGVDILFYWFHRAGHRINILWAAHATHHSTEELNYAVALRTSFTQRAASFLFYWPLAVIGFEPQTIVPIVAINLIIQFIPHTRVIPRLPRWIDAWLNTPYHHRIHHGANPIYWDKNYSGTFIIWDKIFGTYQDEVEPVFYGITAHPRSWDPTWLNVHWFTVIWNDMCAATHWQDKILVWLKPPGWRPRNLPPFGKTPAKSAANQIKYRTIALENSTSYLIFQLVVLMLTMFYVIRDKSPLLSYEKGGMTIVLWLGITMWGAIMESKTWAKLAESARILVMSGVLYYLFTKYSEPMIFMQLMLATSAISLAMLWFYVKNPTAEALKANQDAKIAPDYKQDWVGEKPAHSSF